MPSPASPPPLRLASLLLRQYQFFRDVHAGFRNFCRDHAETELARFQTRSFLNLHALTFLEVNGVIGPFPRHPVSVPPEAPALPTVNVSHSHRHLRVPSVINDDLAVGALAADFFLPRNARNFAVLTLRESWLHYERAIGFRRRLRQAGKPCSAHILDLRGHADEDSHADYFHRIHDALRRFCRTLPRPCAVFCTQDRLASRLVDAAQTLDLRIPGDLQILGCDNETSVQEEALLPISSIQLNGRQIGWTAGETLVRLLHGEAIPPRTRIPPLRILERATTSALQPALLVAKAMELLRKDLPRHGLEVASVASQLDVSRRSLEVAFQRELNESPYRYLLRQRLDRACQLLRDTDHRINEIADLTGFGDLRSFGTAFRREFDLSPRRWRKIHAD